MIYSHPTRTVLAALAELAKLDEPTRHGNPLEVSRNRVCVEIRAIPDPDHTQEVRGSGPLAPTIISPGENHCVTKSTEEV
jgi:hypothetical protein